MSTLTKGGGGWGGARRHDRLVWRKVAQCWRVQKGDTPDVQVTDLVCEDIRLSHTAEGKTPDLRIADLF